MKRCQLFLFEMEVETDRYREISGGANSVAPTTFESFLQDTASQRMQDALVFVQACSLAAIAAGLPVRLNLESERRMRTLLRVAKKITSVK